MRKNQEFESFCDGVCTVYRIAPDPDADMPVPKLAIRWPKVCFAERVVGLKRKYEAKQVDEIVERVIRVPRIEVSAKDVVVIGEDQYKVDDARQIFDARPPCTELTLSHVEETYDIAAI